VQDHRPRLSLMRRRSSPQRRASHPGRRWLRRSRPHRLRSGHLQQWGSPDQRSEVSSAVHHRTAFALELINFRRACGLLNMTAVLALPMEMLAPARRSSSRCQGHQISAIITSSNDTAWRASPSAKPVPPSCLTAHTLLRRVDQLQRQRPYGDDGARKLHSADRGIPIVVDGQIVGGVGVSGAASADR